MNTPKLILLISILLLLVASFAKAQTISNPNVEYSSRKDAWISQIKTSNTETAITISVNGSAYRNDWYQYFIEAVKKTYIFCHSNRKYLYVTRADGIRLNHAKQIQKSFQFTLYFSPIPSDCNLIDLVSEDDSGFTFRKIGLSETKAQTAGTYWNEYYVKQNIDSNNDGICGIYEGTDTRGYKLGCVKHKGEYNLIYLGCRTSAPHWRVGDVKAVLRPSATEGLFMANWYMLDKSISNTLIFFDGISMESNINGDRILYIKMYPTTSDNNESSTNVKEWSGSGWALKNGYIVTNHHVVDGAKSIKVKGIKGDFNTEYNAKTIVVDANNDLAIIKIDDNRFTGFGTIPYKVKTTLSDVGEEVFVLGYPMTDTMGDEIKLTTGVISSRTGFMGDISLYQISAPIQPGNSGGPLFDSRGNVIGIVNAKHKGTENVSYAIKASYLNNLAESTTSTPLLPSNNTISGLSLSNKVKNIKNFVFMINCTNSNNENNSHQSNSQVSLPSGGNVNNNGVTTIRYPYVEKSPTHTRIRYIKLSRESTSIEIEYTNYYEYGGWCNIEGNTYILVNGTRYNMTKAEGIQISPQKTTFSYQWQTVSFILYFPPIPTSANSLDLIESENSSWKWYGVDLTQ